MEDQSQPQETQEASTTTTQDFISSLPEDLREDPSIKDFKDPAALAKSYISAQRMLGSSIRIPGEDASEEAKQEFYKKLESVPGITRLPDPEDKESLDQFYSRLGRPESPDNYKYELPEGIEPDPVAIEEFSNLAFELGLSSEQAQKLAQFDAQRAQRQIEEMSKSKESADAILRQTWGHDYDNRMESAKAVVETYSKQFPDAVKELVSGPAGNNPAVLAMLSDLGKALNETGALQGQTKLQFGLTPEDAKMKLDEIMANKSHPYWDDTNPNHRDAVERVYKLNQAITGS